MGEIKEVCFHLEQLLKVHRRVNVERLPSLLLHHVFNLALHVHLPPGIRVVAIESALDLHDRKHRLGIDVHRFGGAARRGLRQWVCLSAFLQTPFTIRLL